MKHALADRIRALATALGPLADTEAAVEALLSRLAEDRFNLVVVGEFGRGKSSLINAILGRPLLPTAAVPLTSVVTAVRYGAVERASVLRQSSPWREEIPVTAVQDFVTERRNPGNRKGVASVEVEAPAPFLKRGLYLVDTPGVGSAHAESTAVTRAYLPEADAAVFVTSAEAPMSNCELQFLELVRSEVRKIFFVVNKVDGLSSEERAEVALFAQQTLASRLGVETPRVFPLSSRLALQAKAAGVADAFGASGLPALELALAEFLGPERRRIFLAAVLDRALRLVGRARFAAEVRRRQTGPDSPAVKARLAELLKDPERARREALAQAEARLVVWEREVLAPVVDRFARSAPAGLRSRVLSAGGNSRSSPAEYYAELLAGRRLALAEQAAAWVDEHRVLIESMATNLSEELGRSLAAAVTDIGRISAEALGVDLLETETRTAPWDQPPRFELPSADPSPAASDRPALTPLLPRPAILGRHIARRLVVGALPTMVGRTAEDLRGRIHAYLEACVRRLDGASARAMALALERVGADPTRSCGGPAALDTGALDRIAKGLSSLRDAILAAGDAPLDPPTQAIDRRARPVLKGEPETSGSRPMGERCPICTDVLASLFDFMSQFQFLFATDPRTQAQFSEDGGFCPLHAWQLEELSSPRGLAGGYPTLLERTGERLRTLGACTVEQAARLLGELTPHCAACLDRARAEEASAASISRHLMTEEGSVALDQSGGFCLLHVALLLPRLSSEAARALLRHHSRRCQDLAESLQAYALKFDAHRQDLLSRAERTGQHLSVALFAGEPRVF